MKPHMVFLNGHRFAHHPGCNPPVTQFITQQVFPELIADHAGIRSQVSPTPEADSISTQKIHFLFLYVTESWYVAVAGIATIGFLVFETFKSCTCFASVIVPGNIFAKQSIFISQTTWKP